MTHLTPRQREILDFIRASIASRGVAPTLREISDAFGFTAVSTAQRHVERLCAKGVLRRVPHRSRGLELTGDEIPGVRRLPLLGEVAAGAPIEAYPAPDSVAVPAHLAPGDDLYVLRVRGDSMIEDGIHDGDLVVVRRRDTAAPGETVVALVDGEVTLKRYRPRPPGRVILEPANPAIPPLEVPAARVRVQGIVVALLRRYPTAAAG